MKIDGLTNLTSQSYASEAKGGKAASEAKRPVDAVSERPLKPNEDSSKPNRSDQQTEAPVESLNAAIDEVNAQFASRNATVRFKIDQESKELIVTVVDRDSDEVIREIPPEEVVRMRERFKEMTSRILEETV